jgi:hypothetical protein
MGSLPPYVLLLTVCSSTESLELFAVPLAVPLAVPFPFIPFAVAAVAALCAVESLLLVPFVPLGKECAEDNGLSMWWNPPVVEMFSGRWGVRGVEGGGPMSPSPMIAELCGLLISSWKCWSVVLWGL